MVNRHTSGPVLMVIVSNRSHTGGPFWGNLDVVSLHFANYDNYFDYHRKTIAVFGTGSSGF
jgi:hypothetical protein